MRSASTYTDDHRRKLTLDHAIAAADTAAAAFWDWSSCSYQQRCLHLQQMSAALDAHRDQLINIARDEIGAASRWTDFNINLAINILDNAQQISSALQSSQVVNQNTGVVSHLQRTAAGVVLGIAPWNAAVTLATRAVAMPLACGNTVVLKGSEHCPRTHETLISIFNDSGLPEGVLNYVGNEADIADVVVNKLIEHQAIRRINFTGSTRVGREIAVQAARHLKPCLLELSDKAPLLIMEDADLPAAVEAVYFGAFFNQGQICMATERVIVLDAIADEFVAALVNKVAALIEDPDKALHSLGQMINDDAATRVRGLIDDAINLGGELLIGGEVTAAVMQPAIVDRVSSAMRLYHEEVFGPVASILRVRDEDEAISIANDTRFGLTAGVFSNNIKRAHNIADRLETGIVQINGSTVFDDPQMPFGGMKDSGYGRFGSTQTVNEFTELRWIAEHPAGTVPSIKITP